MSSLPDLSPPLGPASPPPPAANPALPVRQPASYYAAHRRPALPDTTQERFRARSEPDPAVSADTTGYQGPPTTDGPADTDRTATGKTKLWNPTAEFLTQILGQSHGPDQPEGLRHDRDGPVKGSDAYRRAGGEPEVYSTSPTVFRIAV